MKNRTPIQAGKTGRSRGMLLTVLLSYVFLLVISYGFPIVGDDWYFFPRPGTWTGIFDPLTKAYETAAHHYITTNGRLLGNFLVKFTAFSKILRELIRCGIILGVVLCVHSLSGTERHSSPFRWLTALTLLVAIPARIAAQTYAWSSGFFNYVPPTLCFLIYALYVRAVFCGPERRSSFLRCLGLFLLGLAGSFFMENQTVAFCLLSLAVFIVDWIRNKKLRPALLLCFLGAALGCWIMFRAPGYHNVGTENYRSIPQSLDELIQVGKENFQTLSGYLTRNNWPVICLLSLGGAGACLRRYPKAGQKLRLVLRLSMAVSLCCPVLFYAQDNLFSRYHFLLDLAANALYFLNLLLIGLLTPEKPAGKFTPVFCAVCFVLFISPLMVVHPVGPRNAYFFDVLLIAMSLSLLHTALEGLSGLRPLKTAVCLACCLVLLGNLLVYYRNGKVETLRHQIVAEAMERGERQITLPLFPYNQYTHRSSSRAISYHYYYEKRGDIAFEYVPYSEWISTH